ncbi:CBS domain-containing protein [Halioxenophilus sp. WMMB6]|uniref:CBS domain-containing protein n=1 Tax=Halioxenophilus sp. WMMB6 TaxID=3073815 RepID=UPI00295EB2DF|nr:CBS domain-containing protein [Halioxenophilus sp. WMMB6]
MQKLALLDSSCCQDLASPYVDGHWSLTTPAVDLLTDFSKEAPVFVDVNFPAAEAIEILRRASVRLLMVLGKDDHLVGVVGFDRLNGQELIRKISSGYHRDELTVSEFMTPKSELKALAYDQFAKATLQEVLYTLDSSGLHHCLVIDTQTHKIRGVISAYEIAQKLGLPLNLIREPNFGQICSAVYRQVNPRTPLCIGVN